MKRIAAWLCLGIALAQPAYALGDAQRGRRLAEIWCSACHAVDRAQAASDAAPPFATIAQHGERSPQWLRSWLTAPHAPMPDPGLSRQEIDDILAYLQELGRPR